MSARFTVLASGSSGNASLLEWDGFGLLIDCGLPPRELGRRLAAVGRGWEHVSAVLLTHTHGDHWNRFTLGHLARLRRPLVAHPRHHDALEDREEHQALAAVDKALNPPAAAAPVEPGT
jgi:glyoxylase-like metal-dependent hydrolase (beta-lactamase superfamily II)